MKPLLTVILFLFFQNLLAQNSGCADTSYRMWFSSPGKEFNFYIHCNTRDGGTVLAGNIINVTNGGYELGVIKLNAAGNVIWKKIYPNPKRTFISRVLEQSNGEIALLGYFINVNTNPEIIIMKISSAGNLLWCNRYSLDSRFDYEDELHSYHLSEGLNNDLLFTFKDDHYANSNSVFDDDSSYAIITRINNAGTIQWSKAFSSHSNNIYTNPSGVFVHNGDVYTFGYSDDSYGACLNGVGSLYAMRLNYNTGSLLQLKTYCHYAPQSNNPFGFAFVERTQYNSVKLLNNQFALFGRFSAADQYGYSYKVLINDRLDIVQAILYKVPFFISFYNNSTVTVLPDGTTHISGTIGGSQSLYWAAFDSSNRVVRERKLPFQNVRSGFLGSMSFAYKNKGTYNFSTNYTVNSNRYSLFTQVQNNDPAIDSCLGTDTAFVGSNAIAWSPAAWTWKSIIDNPVTASPVMLTPSDFGIQAENRCTQISRCDSLRITGPDTLCVTDGFVSFTGLKNPDCRKRVLWEMNLALVDASYQPNDSTLNVRFKPLSSAMPQTLTLYASAANCTVAKDTAQVVLLPGPKPLPPDTVVCGAVNIRLTPGKWGKSYLWQDGSTDSVFIATDTGRYTLQVRTFCGATFFDTISIARPSVSLGADKTPCKGDTVVLSATPGFSHYQWRANGSPLSANGSSLSVSPGSTTQYTVAAQTGSGCTVSDTLVVTVHQTLLVNLGQDTAFCTGDSLRLQAPPSFQTYQWNTGGKASFVRVYNSGVYWVKATDNNGCSASDSITILPLYPKPVVSLSPKGVVCVGQSDTLRTGSFGSYRWSNGSRLNYLPVSDTGTYWVTVIDARGCTGNDTARIVKRAFPPVNFLPKDTVVCAGEAVELKPLKTFNRYLWSNGATSPSVTVSEAKLYLLRATDNDGCVGNDSIRVSLKDCPNKIFFPSAFSPNGDGRNDLFTPFVEGRLLEYRFTVYNRWGQVVFATTDYKKGWGGYLNSVPQNTGAFVWLCQFRFSNEEKKTMKGTVLLIR